MEFYIYEQRGQEHFKRPCRFSPRCRLRVTFSEVAYFDLEDGDFFVVSKPSIDMKIKVSFDGGKFDVRATPDDALVDDWEIGDEPGQWKIGGALLPGQGIHFWWEPHKETNAQEDCCSGNREGPESDDVASLDQ